MIRASNLTGALIALSALIAASASASFTPLGVVDGLKVNGSSPDSSYIVGQYIDANGDKIAMRWDITGTDPLEDLGELLTGKIESEARAASGDGSVVVGDSRIEDPNKPGKDAKEAFIWEDGVMTGLGFLEPGIDKVESVATAVSEDGLVVAGRSKVTDPNAKSVKQAFIWEADVMTGLGFLADDGIKYESEALGISGDGYVVVGKAENTHPNDATKSVKEAFIWEGGVMTGLGFLQDDTSKVESEATAASYDGTTVVGNSRVDDPNDPNKRSVKQAFIWEADVMMGLGFLADATGPFESKATGVSADGSVVVGESKNTAGTKEAFIWTAVSNEMRSLRDVLEEDLGVDLTGWTLDKPPVISSDGQTMIALATNPSGDVEAFVSYVPEPAGGIYAGIALLVWLDRRRSIRLKRASAETS
jgi:probable HAF family extracellular repeat protein